MLNISYTKDLETKSQRTPVDQNYFNKRFKVLFDALVDLDNRVSSFGSTEGTLVQLGLQRLDEVLSPLLTTLAEAAELGFLVCRATGVSASLTVGAPFNVNVTDGAALFTPTTYLLALDDNDETNWGVLILDQWEKTTGDLATHCLYASKNQASTSWEISCNSALPAALADMLADAQTARDEAVAADASIAAQLVILEDAIAAINAGPVASVAGRTGIIVLGISDVVGLVDALGGKATTAALSTGLGGKQNSSVKLDALAGMTWASNKIVYATSATSLGMLDVSDFGKTLIDDTNGSAALATLGVTLAMRMLLTSADNAAALTQLGFSAFGQALINDVDAPTARGTLGAASAASVPAKATAGDVTTGTDDDKFVTAAGIAGSMRGVNTQTGDYTLLLSDNRKIVRINSSTNRTLFLPANFPVGYSCRVIQSGTGTVTFSPQAGATRNMPGAATRTTTQYAQVELSVNANAGGTAAFWVGDGAHIT